MIKKILSIFFLVLLSFSAKCQGVGGFNSVNECYGKTFSVVAWVLTDTAGNPNFDQETLQLAIDSTNNYFGNICVDFKICEFNVLPNHAQDTIYKGGDDSEITQMYRRENVINLYFFTDIIDTLPGTPSPCGYAPLGSFTVPQDEPMRDAIFLEKACFDQSVFMHEIGHYFGLYHTWEVDEFGRELNDGSNCATTGDLICDTDADPYPTGSVGVNCNYSGPLDVATGLYYTPPVCNIMTYWTSPCRQSFTVGQYNRMLSIMKTGRRYLW